MIKHHTDDIKLMNPFVSYVVLTRMNYQQPDKRLYKCRYCKDIVIELSLHFDKVKYIELSYFSGVCKSRSIKIS